ncbi:DUF1254 domain-containing protein [Lutimonas halocynthiae]|uniref:DUF1254 domain-containing protein n=1 Tax=Lutimonas halocynthiae TaxID=1446477 RepID=UPI0025B46031|nr:DUF1254 domain-containing protein [Lutimonas halocynthiae]MDN3643863.1 DUF1254 domain-containing protein [Lutimonas halocynthiae]
MKKIFNIIPILTLLIMVSCGQNKKQETPTKQSESLKELAYDAFVYAYPMLEQLKAMDQMFKYMGSKPNVLDMNSKYPMENINQPIVATNLTSMTGGGFIDISGGPVTLEIPEIKDRYVVYQFIDVFTHNFFYLGTRANNGDAGRFTFYNEGQELPTHLNSKPVLVEGDHFVLVCRIDIKDRSELEHVVALQNAIKIIDAPKELRTYPNYDKEKAYSPSFVEYVNSLLTEVPSSEKELFKKWEAIGVMADVNLNEAQLKEVQAGIDSAYAAITNESKNLEIGNGYFSATEVFGTREFLNGNYMARAAGAFFGLYGNSKEEANYFMLNTEGEGKISFSKEELPPLTNIGFWSITIHDENIMVKKNEYDSYVLTTDKMQFEEDGSLVLSISSQPEEGNWLYTPGGKMVILIRAYQADPDKIGSYIPPAFVQNK